MVPPDVELDLDDVTEYPIQEILFSRVWGRDKISQYRIRWGLPYGPESDSWESAENLEECTALDTFLAKQGNEGEEHITRRRSPRLLTSIP